jgi:hypothetical protein
MGARLGDAGPSAVCFAVWLAERKARHEPFVVHENTEDFNSDTIAEVLGATHEVLFIKLDPRQLGYPQRRPRKITIAIRRDFVLTIPLESFLNLMGRRIAMTPEGYFVMGGENSKTEQYELAEKANVSKGRQLFSGGCPTAPWSSYLLLSQVERLGGYRQMLAETKADSDQSAWVADLDQDPRHRARYCNASVLGESLPCHISHGCMWHVGKQRQLLAHEVLLCQGSAVVPEITGKPQAWPALALLRKGASLPREPVAVAVSQCAFATRGGRRESPEAGPVLCGTCVPSRCQPSNRSVALLSRACAQMCLC